MDSIQNMENLNNLELEIDGLMNQNSLGIIDRGIIGLKQIRILKVDIKKKLRIDSVKRKSKFVSASY